MGEHGRLDGLLGAKTPKTLVNTHNYVNPEKNDGTYTGSRSD